MRESFRVINNLSSIEEVLAFAHSVGRVLQQKDCNGKLYATLSPAIAINKQAYGTNSLFVHTDRSTLDHPPEYVLIWYETMPDYGGLPTIFDAKELLTPRINEFNFEAIYGSENDSFLNKYKLYDAKKDIFRFRRDNYIYVNQNNMQKYNKLIDFINQNIIKIKIKSGQCLLIKNNHIFHGRTSFSGDRVIHRVHIYEK